MKQTNVPCTKKTEQQEAQVYVGGFKGHFMEEMSLEDSSCILWFMLLREPDMTKCEWPKMMNAMMNYWSIFLQYHKSAAAFRRHGREGEKHECQVAQAAQPCGPRTCLYEEL